MSKWTKAVTEFFDYVVYQYDVEWWTTDKEDEIVLVPKDTVGKAYRVKVWEVELPPNPPSEVKEFGFPHPFGGSLE